MEDKPGQEDKKIQVFIGSHFNVVVMTDDKIFNLGYNYANNEWFELKHVQLKDEVTSFVYSHEHDSRFAYTTRTSEGKYALREVNL